MSKWRAMALVSASAALTGCSLAPGQHLDVYNHYSKVEPWIPAAKVTIVPVDVNVVAKQVAYQSHFDYRVGPQDVLNITVWDHPELTIPAGQYRTPAQSGILVNAQGNIFYPFAGNLHVEGMTVDQIRSLLSKHLAKYIQQPQVSVRVALFASQKVQVIGAVQKPTTQPISNVPLSLMDAINAANGFEPAVVNAKNVYVLRGPLTHPTLFWLNANNPTDLLMAEKFYLRNRDIVYVSTSSVARLQRILAAISPAVQAGYYIHELTH